MPTRKPDDESAEQKKQDLAAKAKEMMGAQQERLERATERMREQRQRTYTVQEGDTLGKIAVKFYKDGERWTEIYKANKAQIADPNVIEVGQKLVIP
jgi:nucleoid-associated protein YgaU